MMFTLCFSPCQQRKPALELPYSSENLRAGYQECVCWSLPQPLSARDRILCFGHVSLLSSHPAVPVQPRPFLQLFLNYSSSNPSSGYSSTQFASSCHLHKVRCGICVELCYIAQGCVGFFLLNRQLVYVYARLKILSLDAHSFPENYFPYEWVRFKDIEKQTKPTLIPSAYTQLATLWLQRAKPAASPWRFALYSQILDCQHWAGSLNCCFLHCCIVSWFCLPFSCFISAYARRGLSRHGREEVAGLKVPGAGSTSPRDPCPPWGTKALGARDLSSPAAKKGRRGGKPPFLTHKGFGVCPAEKEVETFPSARTENRVPVEFPGQQHAQKFNVLGQEEGGRGSLNPYPRKGRMCEIQKQPPTGFLHQLFEINGGMSSIPL